MRIVISEFMDRSAVELLAAHHDTLYDPDLVDRREVLKAPVADADALIVRNRTQVNAELLAAASRLKVVGRLGVGLDNIDVGTCESRGMLVIPATGANALAVAEYVIGTAMLLLRGAYAFDGGRRRGQVAAVSALERPRAWRKDARHRRLRQHRPPHGAPRPRAWACARSASTRSSRPAIRAWIDEQASSPARWTHCLRRPTC